MRWRPNPLIGRNGPLRASSRAALAAGVVLAIAAAFAATSGLFSGRSQAAADATRPAAGPRQPASSSASHGTSCASVAHIGDSTSVGMVSSAWLPDAGQRLAPQYRDIGVRQVRIDASGGRSIVEEMPGQQNGDKVANAWYDAGFRGCWVFALGTNDTANVAVGSRVSLMSRIGEMMSAAHGEPVLWVNVQTDLASGPWSEANMQLWNNALVQASKVYPNMRIFNWAGMVQPSWHLADGIHYTSAGYAIRAAAIAHALERAFPANGQRAAVMVGS